MLQDEFPETMLHADLHVSDVFQTGETQARATWYSVSGIPHTRTDGMSPRIGASDVCNTEYNVFRQKYLQRMTATGGVSSVDVTGSYIIAPGPGDPEFLEIQATATFEQVEPATLSNLRGSIVVTQNHIDLGVEYNHIVEYIYDEMITLNGVGDQATINMTVPVIESEFPQINWNIQNLELIAYVQTLGTSKEVYQAARLIWENAASVDNDIAAGPVRLLYAEPNPFRPMTRIGYRISDGGAAADLGVYDLGGRRVATLFRGQASEGVHEAVWTGSDDVGNPLASGVYFIRLISGEKMQVQKVIRLE